MAESVREDWQSNQSFAETNRYMWTNKICCDVVFHVGKEKAEIKAHKYILMSRSVVFYTMFNGSLPENTNKPISIPDVEPDAFKLLCLFLYTETVQVTVDNVLSLLHAAKIYMVQNLIDKCLQRLKGKMLPENLCLIMEAAHIFGEPELRERSRNKILQNPKQVLTSDSLAELCSECLQSILEDDHLRLEEEEIFESVMKYSENICLKEQLPVTPENQRKVLGKAFQHIRFTLMDKTYFTDVVEPMGILKFDETLAVLKYFLNPQFSSTPFNTIHRNTYKIVNRFKTINSGWKYKRNNIDAISCECSENIQIHGILIYTNCDGAKEFNAKVTILDQPTNTTKVMQVFKVESDGEMKSYECIFNNPIYIPKGEIFTICLEVKSGKTTYWGEDGQDTVDNDGVSFTFMNSSLSLNNTTCDRGQIPGIIYTLDKI